MVLIKAWNGIKRALGLSELVGADVYGNTFHQRLGKRWMKLPSRTSEYDPNLVARK